MFWSEIRLHKKITKSTSISTHEVLEKSAQPVEIPMKIQVTPEKIQEFIDEL